MKKTRTYTYEKHVFLDQIRMGELHTILKKHCDRLEISVKTLDNSKIEFESFNELMEYSNFKKDRIQQLNIYGYSQKHWYSIIDLTISSKYSTLPPVDCTYQFDQEDEETVFVAELQKLFDKSKRFHVPAIVLGWISSFLICIITLAALYHSGSNMTPIMYAIMISVISLALNSFFNSISTKLFPPVYFSWGEAVSYYNQLIKWRSNLFWCVIVAFIVGFFVTIVSNGLFST